MSSRLAIESSRIEGILNSLMAASATDVESQTLEFKGWGRDEKDLSRLLAEATVCLANADGGLVIVGVHDRNVRASRNSTRLSLQTSCARICGTAV